MKSNGRLLSQAAESQTIANVLQSRLSIMTTILETDVLSALNEIADPEMSVVSIVELGIVREVKIDGESVEVTLAPTFSACPALSVIQASVRDKVLTLGFADVRVKLSFSPPWTTDWISESGRGKLKTMGIAPPGNHGGDVLTVLEIPAQCPYCGSRNTTRRNSFGPTPCRAIYFCNQCVQPFERMKAL
jgi:ring-1,2-phenylacetyl-CoA epoxidase subunit PaaD